MAANRDESAIRALVDGLVAGWNAGSGADFAASFAEDADFTAVTGLRAQGRELIARGHDEILSTIYRGSRLSVRVNDIRFLRPDVAAVDAAFHFERQGPVPMPDARCGFTAVRDDGVWRIVIFRNMVPHGRQSAGPLEQSLLAESR